MTIELVWFIASGVALLSYIIMRNWLKVLDSYTVTRKGRNFVVRDSKGRFVRITPNFWDVLSLGVDL